MEGGAMRGLFTCGVIDVLMENGIDFDGAAGTSAGAAFGCNFKSKQIGRPRRYNERFCNDKRYSGFGNLIKYGDLYPAEFCYHRVPEELDPFDSETFTNNPMEFYVCCTNVKNGKAIYHKCTTGLDEDVDWIRASASMPIVSSIVKIRGYELLDGGVGESIPLPFMMHKGYNHNVVILTQPYDFVKKPNKMVPLVKQMYRKYPEFVKAFATRHIRYNKMTRYIKDEELADRLFVIRPPEALHIKSRCTDPDELERVYQIGRKTAEGCLEELKAYMARA